MDNMFTQIDEIKNELDALNSAVNQFASSGGGCSSTTATNRFTKWTISRSGVLVKTTSTIKGKIAKITTELNLMKQ